MRILETYCVEYVDKTYIYKYVWCIYTIIYKISSLINIGLINEFNDLLQQIYKPITAMCDIYQTFDTNTARDFPTQSIKSC